MQLPPFSKLAVALGMALVISHGATMAADAAVVSAQADEAITIAGPYTNAPARQVLAKVGDQAIMAIDLEQALASSPVSTQFMSMNEDDQARVRGDMLQRLITAELIYLEAVAEGFVDSDAYRTEMASFRTGLLAQAYLNKLRSEAAPPADVMADIKERFREDGDAQEAAKATYVAQRYPELKAARIAALRDQFGLKTYPERLSLDGDSAQVVAEGDGVEIRLGDLRGGLDAEVTSEPLALMQRRLEDGSETALLARAAIDVGINVDGGLERYGHDLASRLLLRAKQKAWVPDEAAMRAWFDANPSVGEIPTRWHVGQIVLKTREDAEKVSARIKAGESLFNLAGELSIDPYGREHNGDMGWFRAGQGLPEIEKVLDSMKDGEISSVLETQLGFHLLTVLERRPGSQKTYDDVHDRVEQAMIAEQLPDFLVGLEKKYGVSLDPGTPD
ncbi:MAG: peptidylprolyl isomerase [Gammaproteobacteria bacterium]|nr:peptidylprolyl isomerase [Gammaproteobacteria bacterium]MCP5137476.1 peptidylprolyl isomerase [Gammaproteobacteria bacterium]